MRPRGEDVLFWILVVLVLMGTSFSFGYTSGHRHMCRLEGFATYDEGSQKCVK